MGRLNPSLFLRQQCTWWAAVRQGSGIVYAAPVLLPCRWELNNEIFRGPNAEDLVSNAVVYLGTDVSEGDFLALADWTSHPKPSDVLKAGRVQKFLKTPTIDAQTFERRALL
jgi:hypothetical protein